MPFTDDELEGRKELLEDIFNHASDAYRQTKTTGPMIEMVATGQAVALVTLAQLGVNEELQRRNLP